MTFSQEYYAALAKTKAVHEAGRYYTGHFIRRHIPRVQAVITELGCQNVLDYGCGRHADKLEPSPSQEWGIPITWYDPGVERFAQRPEGRFDLVVVCQVLCAIPTQDREAIIKDIYSLAKKAVFFMERGFHIKKKKRAIGVQYDTWQAKDFLALLERHRPKKVETFLYYTPQKGCGSGVQYRIGKDGITF